MNKVHVIINPASGRDEAVLNVLNRVFRQHEVEWDVAITHEAGDAQRLAREAVAAGADLIAGYGGDGTLMEIANVLANSPIPLGILPGGTGNSVARECGIPMDLRQAAELLCRASRVRRVDLGRIDERYFMLHAYSGMQQSQRADRQLKNSVGIFAYLLQTLKVLRGAREVRYRVTVDGNETEADGIVCLIVNALSVGLDVAFAEAITPDDGYLDLLLVKEATLAILPELLHDEVSEEHVQHWRAREIAVDSEVTQEVWVDGEPDGSTPFTAVAVPQALSIVVPE